MNSKHIILRSLLLGSLAALACACDLTESMRTEADRTIIFGKESGLELYTNSFYKDLPTLSNCYQQDAMCDIAAVQGVNQFLTSGYTAETSTSWSWGTLRNINYFIDGCYSDDCAVEASARDNYVGIARWFRAWFYYTKLRQYGAVPWFEHQLQPDDMDLMYKDRDSRDVIIRNLIADLDFAYDHITTTSSVGNSLISKYAAAALKSRVCLFEASYRRYHADEPAIAALTEFTPEELYAQAVDAARKVIDSKLYSLNKAGETPYRDLFTRESPLTNENILVLCASGANGYLGTTNWWFNVATYGRMWSPVRSFVNTYLNTDGSRFTDQADYARKSFSQELVGRDKRLEQSIRGLNYLYDGEVTVAQLGIANLTGYHMIKFSQDGQQYENGKNTNSIPIIRYAEVLLNYAEAQAELNGGKLTSSDWELTIGALRERAGVSPTQPTSVDTYLQKTFYPDLTSVDLLEIRRERAIELLCEGFRFDDLRRWKCGELLVTLPWNGIHFPALNTPHDLNGDGVTDVCILTPGSNAPSGFAGTTVELKVVFENESEVSTEAFKEDGTLKASYYAVGSDQTGYDLYWFPGEERIWYEDDRQYLYPIPAQEIRNYLAAGYTLTQNPGWTN